MKLDKANQRIFVRQSWLNDAVTCAERSRLGMVKPEMRTGSDATMRINTKYISGQCASPSLTESSPR